MDLIKTSKNVLERTEADLAHLLIVCGGSNQTPEIKNYLINLYICTNVFRRAIEDGKIERVRQVINQNLGEYLNTGEMN